MKLNEENTKLLAAIDGDPEGALATKAVMRMRKDYPEICKSLTDKQVRERLKRALLQLGKSDVEIEVEPS